MIIRCTKYDLLQLPMKEGQLYYVTDLRAVYQDLGVHKTDRRQIHALVLNTEYERGTVIRPQNGFNYYVIESNNLWTFDAKWVLRDGDVSEYNAYAYSGTNGITPVVTLDPYICNSETGDRIIDNNGLLGDGSVVVRDSNRIIRGKLGIDYTNNELSIIGYQDNGITIYPYGLESVPKTRRKYGALHLGIASETSSESTVASIYRRGKAEYNGDFYVIGDVYSQVAESSFKYELSRTPEAPSKMVHNFSTTKSVEEDSSNVITHFDFSIEVISDTDAKVTVVEYRQEADSEVVGEHGEMLYDGKFVWGSEKVYNATRVIDRQDKVSYKLIGDRNENTFTLEGSPSSAVVTFNTFDYINEGASTVYAITNYYNIQCLSNHTKLEEAQSEISKLQSKVAELEAEIQRISKLVDKTS